MATIIMSAESDEMGTTARRTLADFAECTEAFFYAVSQSYPITDAADMLLQWLKNDGTTAFQFEHVACTCGQCNSKLVVSYLP